MKTLRIGFVGSGSMGQMAHLRNYASIPACEVVAVAELREDLRQRVAARYGIARSYPSHRELLANESLDGIVAIQQYTMHGQLIPELLPAGCPILVEKPLARSPEMGRAIAAAAAAADVPIYVGYHKRSDPATIYARATLDAWLSSGEMGNLNYIRIAMPPGDWIANGFAELISTDEPQQPLAADPPTGLLPESDLGAYEKFVNYYIHQVNLLRHLLGEDYRAVYARRHLAVVESARGVSGVIEMETFNSTIDWQESAAICFDRGHIDLGLPAPLVLNRSGAVEIFKDPGDGTPIWQRPVLPFKHAMRQQAEFFVAALRGEQTPLCTAAEAIKDLEVARDITQLQNDRRPPK
jgi:predicted dehydrogenase